MIVNVQNKMDKIALVCPLTADLTSSSCIHKCVISGVRTIQQQHTHCQGKEH